MNNVFVYRKILVKFDSKIGYFIDFNCKRFTFKDKNTCLDFINEKIRK